MKKIAISVNQTNQTAYNIIIGSGILTKLKDYVKFRGYSQAIIITDSHVAKHYITELRDSLPLPHNTIILPPGEKEKTITSVELIWKEMLNHQCDRKSLVINIGGGVVCDMGGFAASTYMRGIDFINIPTTILAQVDASVGGKTGIDFAGIKNVIGTFQQPSAVIIDVNTLASLPDRELISGFGEIIKHGLIADKNYFEMVTSKKPREFSEKELIAIIAGSVEIKRDVIEADTGEQGIRKILNFGHTIGHAVESLSLKTDNPLRHGEAVSIGIVAESKISQLLGYITEAEVEKIKQALAHAELPISVKGFALKDILEKIKNDKKNVSGKTRWSLLKHIGMATFDEEVDGTIVDNAITCISHE